MPLASKKLLSALSASAGALCLVAVSSTASVAAATDIFTVTSLTTDSAVYVDANDLAGDDDGFLGVTGTKFLFSGDAATVAYDLSDMGNATVTDVDNDFEDNNWLFSDLKTQTSYYFIAEQPGEPEIYEMTGFQPLDQAGNVIGDVIALSEMVTIGNEESDACTIFASGYGRVVIWDGCLGVLYDIELPTGTVTTITDAATFADYAASTPLLLDYWEVDNYVAQHGVAEFDGSNIQILAVAENASEYPLGIYRYDVQDPAAAPTELLSFGPDPDTYYLDMWKFTVSPATNQWCSGSEGGWDAIVVDDTISELAFCASATFSIAAGPAPAPEPELAATGSDSAASLAIGALALLGGATLLLVARRRTATS